ncbi:ABC transporter permease [Carboxylicivirga sp. A043]|uniref:ABC transporter permease n=1 Tax=Carboxylicivirga litoralis TaxID=2816963 RepID=UPI0021CB90FC|nr:ABC transporter permease [Carboxylicivirga sp. A043]MCU4156524.1 ABC transporter permease [Carboxylicivirga sp. A043]
MKKLHQTIRNILALKHIALFNVIGLTIGMSSFILIAIWTYTHFSYDKNFEHHNEVYLIRGMENDSQESDLVVPFQLAGYIKGKYPEVDAVVSYQYWPDRTKIQAGETILYEEINATEQDILEILDFNFITAKSNLFDASSEILICESLANKLFGSIDCIGNNLIVSDSINATVAGVYKDFPSNSTFQPTSVCLFELDEDLFKPCTEWNNFCYYSLARIKSNASIAALEEKLNVVFQNDHEFDMTLSFYPLDKVHLNHPGEESLLGHVLLVFSSGVLVLIVSCLNFVNLLVASFGRRKKQMAVKGFLGATRFNYILDCWLEIGVYVVLALCFSILISIQALPVISQSFQLNPLEVFGINWFILMHIAIAFLITLIVSLYPSFYYAFRAKQKLVSNTNINSTRPTIGKAFIVFQFGISIIICIAAFVMQRQLNYTSNRDKGYNPEGVIVAECWDYPIQEKKVAITEYLSSNPHIQSFSFTNGSFDGLGSRTTGFNRVDAEANQKELYKVMYKSDEKLFETMQVKMLAGRTFIPEKFNESKSVIINETFASELGGVDSALDVRLKNFEVYQVVGVCSDFLFEDFYTAVEPLVIHYNTNRTYHLLIKTTVDKQMEVQGDVSAFLKSQSDGPFTIKPMSLLVSEMYLKEASQQQLIFIFGLLTIIVSCLGLLGLTFFIIDTKTKEIGIRKVNGAKVSEVLMMLNKDFIKWVAIAFIIACPIAWYAMNSWLSNFAYKTELSWWIFALAGLVAMAIALITVSWQSWKAARRNPVESLRYE